ncbi:hypothetical protein Pst134EA_030304 [Puccinia striiformis f. sp. tritici]|uniref:hypothetical protein n=1 Tax=Puccinia striiformis f. sp. tritici TaxID=168172 RepID=UPI002008254F|nr:hypothetical protein Pst134EA_030304 [Puccinia striiformis f. sp. tritici]KAH9446384.1 hypothetical protein Pst134EA_030304 [Puccinia striiformis f. sp. tritici]
MHPGMACPTSRPSTPPAWQLMTQSFFESQVFFQGAHQSDVPSTVVDHVAPCKILIPPDIPIAAPQKFVASRHLGTASASRQHSKRAVDGVRTCVFCQAPGELRSGAPEYLCKHEFHEACYDELSGAYQPCPGCQQTPTHPSSGQHHSEAWAGQASNPVDHDEAIALATLQADADSWEHVDHAGEMHPDEALAWATLYSDENQVHPPADQAARDAEIARQLDEQFQREAPQHDPNVDAAIAKELQDQHDAELRHDPNADAALAQALHHQLQNEAMPSHHVPAHQYDHNQDSVARAPVPPVGARQDVPVIAQEWPRAAQPVSPAREPPPTQHPRRPSHSEPPPAYIPTQHFNEPPEPSPAYIPTQHFTDPPEPSPAYIPTQHFTEPPGPSPLLVPTQHPSGPSGGFEAVMPTERHLGPSEGPSPWLPTERHPEPLEAPPALVPTEDHSWEDLQAEIPMQHHVEQLERPQARMPTKRRGRSSSSEESRAVEQMSSQEIAQSTQAVGQSRWTSVKQMTYWALPHVLILFILVLFYMFT